MPMRTRLDSPHRDGENWDQALDQRNPPQGTTPVNFYRDPLPTPQGRAHPPQQLVQHR
jgi:hypothetical protein